MQLFDITNKLFKEQEGNECSRMVFLDLSKTLDRVHHGELLFKLKQLSIVDNCLNLFANYLKNCSQHVSFCGITSRVRYINCGVPKTQSLVLFFFNIY